MAPQPDEILSTLVALVGEVLGDDYDESMDIGMTTSFSGELELESIELVALAEKVQGAFHADIDFVGWLSNLELDQIIDLTMGDVVTYIEQSLRG